MSKILRNSVCRELVCLAVMGTAALALAVPLALVEHRGEVTNRFYSDFYSLLSISPPQDSSGNTSAALPTPTQIAWSHSHSPQLSPLPELLDHIDQKALKKPDFSRGAANYTEMIEETAALHGVSPALVKAVIEAESSFNPNAVSNNGAVGLMQILPTTARAMGINEPLDPQANITAGVRYLKMLLTMYDDNEVLAIAAYNCGPEAMKRFGHRLPPYKETIAFVNKVMKYYHFHLDT